MKIFLAAIVFLAMSVVFGRADWQQNYTELLKKYVTPEGVRYAAWKKDASDVTAMQSVVEGIAAEPEPQGRYNQLAFYLNAHNAWILHTALDKYPVKSLRYVLYLPAEIKVAGEKMSFNRLEKEVIQKRFAEPRAHFGLNGGNRSSPLLLNEPFHARGVIGQLDQLTRKFLSSDAGVRVVGTTAELSKIFEWYKDDFAVEGGLRSFIGKYRGKPLPPDAKVTFQEYDWSLNEAD